MAQSSTLELCLLSVMLAVAFYCRSMTGVCLLILICPIQGIQLLAKIGLPYAIRIYLFPMVAIILLVVLIISKPAISREIMVKRLDLNTF